MKPLKVRRRGVLGKMEGEGFKIENAGDLSMVLDEVDASRRVCEFMKGLLLSAYRSVWLMAMFDLPVETPDNKRDYVRFRKALLKDGFMML